MLQVGSQEKVWKQKHFHVGLACSAADIRNARRLRWQVFAEERGARLNTPHAGLDIDLYDTWRDHLLVRGGDSGAVVGTCRILGTDVARSVGSFYADQEFDLTRIGNLRGRMVEVGRSCVHPADRRGGVISPLWSGLAD